jgi:hypothetical protein
MGIDKAGASFPPGDIPPAGRKVVEKDQENFVQGIPEHRDRTFAGGVVLAMTETC